MGTPPGGLTDKMELVQDRLGRPLDQYLREAYWNRRRTFQLIRRDIARATGVQIGLRTLTDWFRHFDIPTTHRPPEEEAV